MLLLNIKGHLVETDDMIMNIKQETEKKFEKYLFPEESLSMAGPQSIYQYKQLIISYCRIL